MRNEREGRLEVATAGDGWDPVAGAAVLLGRKWHAVVLHRLLAHGPLGFNELAGTIEGISNKVLSDCLDDLERKGLVTRRTVSEKPFRVAYGLTGVGETLEPVIAAMEEWSETVVEPAATPDEAVASVPR